MKKVIIIYILIVLVHCLVLGHLLGKVIKEVNHTGLKNIFEQVWEGENYE